MEVFIKGELEDTIELKKQLEFVDFVNSNENNSCKSCKHFCHTNCMMNLTICRKNGNGNWIVNENSWCKNFKEWKFEE